MEHLLNTALPECVPFNWSRISAFGKSGVVAYLAVTVGLSKVESGEGVANAEAGEMGREARRERGARRVGH